MKNTIAVAELAFAQTLAIVKKIPEAYDSVKQFEWDKSPFVERSLGSMSVGIVGYGEVGKLYAKYCRPLFDSVVISDFYNEQAIFSLERRNFDQVLAEADVITLCLPLNRETQGMVDKQVIIRLKKEGAYLINASRGEIIDEGCVLKALKCGRLLGYAADSIIQSKEKPITVSNFVGPAQRLNMILTPGLSEE